MKTILFISFFLFITLCLGQLQTHVDKVKEAIVEGTRNHIHEQVEIIVIHSKRFLITSFIFVPLLLLATILFCYCFIWKYAVKWFLLLAIIAFGVLWLVFLLLYFTQ